MPDYLERITDRERLDFYSIFILETKRRRKRKKEEKNKKKNHVNKEDLSRDDVRFIYDTNILIKIFVQQTKPLVKVVRTCRGKW